MNKIWCFIICVSIVFSMIFGTIDEVNSSIFNQMENATNYIISITFLMGFWSGINNIILHTIIKEYFKKIFKPIYKVVYKRNFTDDVLEYMSINTFGNLFGLGNAATISGLRVIDKLEEIDKKENRKELSDEIILFTVMNTASIQILPITVLNIRHNLCAKNVSNVILYIWFISIISFLFLIIITKVYLKVRKYGKYRENK